jgi:protocatechuate 3,4-dioxygenase beta subunit
MILESEAMVTDAVLYALRHTPDPRLKTIFEAFVRHSHAFIREVKLQEDELQTAIHFFAELGHYTTETRNEMVQASDVMGISSLVALLNKPLTDVESPSTIMGPFYRANAPECDRDDSISRTDSHDPQLVIEGQVSSSDGTPIANSLIDVWQADPQGLYENQDENQPDKNLRGKFRTDSQGRYRLVTLRPGGYPVPTDGPIGTLLAAQGRHAMRPAHIHFIVSAPEHETLITQLYIDEERALIEDVVLAVTAPLVGQDKRRETAESDAPTGVVAPYYGVTFDFQLRPGVPSFPKPPIP